MKKKYIKLTLILVLIFTNYTLNAEEVVNTNSIDIQAVNTEESNKYPDYAQMYIGNDKYESFNRKMFTLNTKLNKYIAKPVHIIWSSVMPKYGIERLRNAYNNIEYPKRLASCIIQRDGKGIKHETARFLTNSTIGLGGLFDPAKKILKIKPTNENMEQALCKCKMKSGSYIIMPCLNSCTPRSMCGRVLEAALDPAVYLASPITSIIKFGLMINRTSYMQPLLHMIETSYADPYDIHKKMYGIENYIKNSNYDREELLLEEKELVEEGHPELAEELIEHIGDYKTSDINTDISAKTEELPQLANSLNADITLENYEIQSPIVDSMKTALFDDKSIDKSIWNELSLWNRSFSKKIKTGNVKLFNDREEYKYKYLLQKDKNAPLMIFYPSIGEGAGNHHSIVFAKMFYDNGYSVVLQGSHFQWEFIKSMPEGFAPGLPDNDSEYVREISLRIIKDLEEKYNYKPTEKIIIGTSFGALIALFTAEKESQNPILNINKFIAISPPVELKYALLQLDKNSAQFDNNIYDIKDKTAITAAKILQLYDLKDEKNFSITKLPFSEVEGKIITSFILRQKLSDIIFTLENIQKNKPTDIYKYINNISYQDYAEKYLNLNLNDDNYLNKTSLFSISQYLAKNDNYKIYEALDDYLVNNNQLQKLKNITGKNLICLNCGSHLGFLHRKEFLEDLKKTLFNIENKSKT